MNGAYLLLFVVLFVTVGPLARWACMVPGCNVGGDSTGDRARQDGASHYRREHYEHPPQCRPCAYGNHYLGCVRHNNARAACGCSCSSTSPVREGYFTGRA